MNRFPGVDYVDFDSLLTEEQRLVRDTVRQWVEDRFKPLVGQAHRDGVFPLELVPESGMEMQCSGDRSARATT